MFSASQTIGDVRKLCNFVPRVGKGEVLARKFIEGRIENLGLDFTEHRFKAKIPEFKKFEIKTDSGKIGCLPCGTKSGRFEADSALDFYKADPRRAFVGFAGKALSDIISTPVFYSVPALAIRKNDINRLKSGGTAELRVNYRTIKSANIIVGNLEKAKIIVSAHYDGWWSGAEDNACWAAILLQFLDRRPKNAAVVWFGCEEIGGDFPVYWAHGSKIFRRDHDLKNIKRIFVLEAAGRRFPTASPQMAEKHIDSTDGRNFDRRKVILVEPKRNIWDFYHSPQDNPLILKREKITGAWNFLNKIVKS